jgi:O-acetyl-ADP-ribose deacetylase (regulator of RNase III)
MASELKIHGTTIKLYLGDITELEVDAIVNAANNRLWMGGGVAGAIKRKGGKEIEDEAVAKGPIPVGEAVVTSAGKLNADYVIHAAGMGTDLRTDERKIREATKNSLLRAEEVNVRSIAFPSIGTGVGGFPVERAAEVMLEVVKEHLEKTTQTHIKTIIFALYNPEAYEKFENALGSIAAGTARTSTQ